MVAIQSAHNKGKSVTAERFRSLKNKMSKYMTSISKNASTNKLDDMVDKQKNTYHRTISIKPIDVALSTYIGFEVNNKDIDHARIFNHIY